MGRNEAIEPPVGDTPAKREVCKLRSLLTSERRCHRHVGYKNSVSRFHQLRYSKCFKLSRELMEDRYRTQCGDEFDIFEPKHRTVTTTRYRDRIPQASYVVNWWYPKVVPNLIPDNYACMKGRGTDLARMRFKQMLMMADPTDYCLCADLKDYFGSILHSLLADEIDPMLGDPWAIWYFRDVIDVNGKDRGIGLGSEMDQLSATALPNRLDQELSGESYGRYMDDFRYIGTLEECRSALERIRQWTDKMGLRISEHKTYIQPISRPVAFLGFTFLRHEDGHVTLKRLRSKVGNERRKLRRMKEKGIPFERVMEHYTCVRATMSKGTRSSKMRMDRYFNGLFGVRKEKNYGTCQQG